MNANDESFINLLIKYYMYNAQKEKYFSIRVVSSI